MSRCPCIKNKRSCSVRCRCSDCGNDKQEKQADGRGCSCRGGAGAINNQTCCDSGSTRACRCPCFKSKISCSDKCNCRGCGNTHGTRNLLAKEVKRSVRIENNPTSYKKIRTSDFMAENKMELGSGTWTRTETVALYCISEEMNSDTVTASTADIYTTYDKLYSSPANSTLLLRKKSLRQIHAKLLYMFRD